MTAVQAPVAFRLMLATELNLISAPMVEAVPIPRTLIATMASTKVNAAHLLWMLNLWRFLDFSPITSSPVHKVTNGWGLRCLNFIFSIINSRCCRDNDSNYVTYAAKNTWAQNAHSPFLAE